jgi:hypothetical protein
MCRRRTERKSFTPDTRAMARLTAAAIAAAMLGVTLGGCSDMYFDRRDTIAFGGGDAVAADQVMQMNDPWPPQSGNTQLATNGQRMQSAIERYRTNVVTQPVDPMQLQTANQAPPTAQINIPSNSAPLPSIGSGTNTTTTAVVTSAPQPSQ